MSVASEELVIDLCEDEDDLDSNPSSMTVTSTAHQLHHSTSSPLQLPPNQMEKMARQLGVPTARLRVGRVSRMLVPKGRGGAVLVVSRNGEMQTWRMCPSLNTWASSASHPGGPASHPSLDPGDIIVISDSEDDTHNPRPHLPILSQAILGSETYSCPPDTVDEDLDSTNIVPSLRVETTSPNLRPSATSALLSSRTRPQLFNPIPGAPQPVPGAAQPIPGAAQPVPRAAQPVPGAAQPILGAAQPVPRASQAFPGAAQPGPGAAQLVLGAAQPGPGAAQPGSGAAQPVPGAAQPGPGAAQPVPQAAQPGSGSAQPGPGAAQPELLGSELKRKGKKSSKKR